MDFRTEGLQDKLSPCLPPQSKQIRTSPLLSWHEGNTRTVTARVGESRIDGQGIRLNATGTRISISGLLFICGENSPSLAVEPPAGYHRVWVRPQRTRPGAWRRRSSGIAPPNLAFRFHGENILRIDSYFLCSVIVFLAVETPNRVQNAEGQSILLKKSSQLIKPVFA